MVPLTFLEQQSQHRHLLFLWFPMLETEVRCPKCSTSGCLQRHHGGWVLLPRVFFFGTKKFTFFKQTAGKMCDWGMRLSGTALPVRCECTGAKHWCALRCFRGVTATPSLATFHVGFESWGLDLAPSEQDLVQLMGTLWNSVFEGEFDPDAVNPWGMA